MSIFVLPLCVVKGRTGSPLPTSVFHIMQVKGDGGRQHSMSLYGHCFQDVHMPHPYMKALVDTSFHWPTSLVKYVHSSFVCAGLVSSRMALSHVACEMFTCNLRCAHAIDNVSFCWPTSTDRCV